MVPEYLYSFAVVETLKGDPVPSFELYGMQPFPSGLPDECLQGRNILSDHACSIAWRNEFDRQSAHLDAMGRDENWERFFEISPFAPSGMGAAEHDHLAETGEDRIIVDCGVGPASFEIGETFLIFRDGTIQLDDFNQLNHLLVSREDDAWVEAVRYLVANPSEDWLPARSLAEQLEPFGRPIVIDPESCEVGEEYTRYTVDLVVYTVSPIANETLWLDQFSFEQREDGASDYLAHCRDGGEFLAFEDAFRPGWEGEVYSFIPLFPIRDGMVDFSHMPSQFAAPSDPEVPLGEVISWFEATHD